MPQARIIMKNVLFCYHHQINAQGGMYVWFYNKCDCYLSSSRIAFVTKSLKRLLLCFVSSGVRRNLRQTSKSDRREESAFVTHPCFFCLCVFNAVLKVLLFDRRVPLFLKNFVNCLMSHCKLISDKTPVNNDIPHPDGFWQIRI